MGIHGGKHISQLIVEQYKHTRRAEQVSRLLALRALQAPGRGQHAVNRMESACYPGELVKRTRENREFAFLADPPYTFRYLRDWTSLGNHIVTLGETVIPKMLCG